MEQKELKIVPPEGYEIDRENSTLECIKFKLIEEKWREKDYEKISGFYISEGAGLCGTQDRYNMPMNYNIFATMKQAKSALAMARISQIMANDERFGGIITTEEWWNEDLPKYIIIRRGGTWYCKETDKFYLSKIDTGVAYTEYYFLAFHTREQRDLFLEENRDLVEDYLMVS